MDQTSPTTQSPQRLYGGTIFGRDQAQTWTNLISAHEKGQTKFCLGLFLVLFLTSLFFPRSIGAHGILYKVREIFLIFSFVSFLWTAFKRVRLWELSKMRRLFAYGLSFLALFGMTLSMILFHGIEERTDQQLQSRSYMKK